MWPRSIKEKVAVSLKRYHEYISNDEYIRSNEISEFRKEWLTNALALIPEEVLKYNEYALRQILQDVFSNYKNAMKKAIMNYILRSPDERKRLHIELIPRKFLTSNMRITRQGGYSIRLYPDWHEFV